MPVCEECKKQVARRVTYRDGRKVCKECELKLGQKEYSDLCRLIIEGHK